MFQLPTWLVLFQDIETLLGDLQSVKAKLMLQLKLALFEAKMYKLNDNNLCILASASSISWKT